MGREDWFTLRETLKIVIMKVSQLIIALAVLLFAFPAKSEEVWKQVLVNEPGTLVDKLGSDMDKITHLTIVGKLDSLDLKALSVLSNGSSLEYIDLYEASLNENRIYKSTFLGCKNLKHITLPKNITRIEGFAFTDCIHLETVKFPVADLDYIGQLAFSGCWNLKDITLGKVSKIDEFAFAMTYYTTQVSIKSVEELCGCAFENCGASYMDLGEDLKKIGFGCFRECKNLKSISFPASLETIERESFLKCSSLRSIYCKVKNPPVVKYDERDLVWFDGMLLCTLYVPKGSKIQYEYDADWKNFYKIVELNNGEFPSFSEITANEVVLGSPIKVYSNNSCINIEANIDTDFAIYDSQGKLIISGKTAFGKNSYSVASGVYFVNTGKLTQKVLVK